MIKTFTANYTNGIPTHTFIGGINANDNHTYRITFTSNLTGDYFVNYELPNGVKNDEPITITSYYSISDDLTKIKGSVKISLMIVNGQQILFCKPVIIQVK